MSVAWSVGLVYFVFFVVQDGVALEDDLLDLLEPALGRSQMLGGLSHLVGLSVWMAMDHQTTRLGAVHVEPLSILGSLTDNGKTWTNEGEALEQNQGYCPTADANDDGQGHPYVASIGGSTKLYTLQRAAGDYEGVGMLVHNVAPSAPNPLAALPASESVGIRRWRCRASRIRVLAGDRRASAPGQTGRYSGRPRGWNSTLGRQLREGGHSPAYSRSRLTSSTSLRPCAAARRVRSNPLAENTTSFTSS